ncbi:hypothetical protein GCM10007881_17420 [Mesorhizobium huakuii]|uniref:hypothetical protein n=1 Tax=Mesorhizobium huakuii TaxID=28104 RepID=UPI00235CE77B|nr:hypothetical protein [Mesorhizobium huakuii]GLQ78226.1 hypothetical protein GCM10007881_17420 [Mesorhizobium huakuii]
MKKLGLGLVLVALAVSACDNKLPPSKAPGAEQGAYVASNPVVTAGGTGDFGDARTICRASS